MAVDSLLNRRLLSKEARNSEGGKKKSGIVRENLCSVSLIGRQRGYSGGENVAGSTGGWDLRKEKRQIEAY